jgi:HD superfamily phosphohydrolase
LQTDNPAPETEFTQHSSNGRHSAGSSGSQGPRRKTLKFVEKEKRLHDRCHGQIALEPLLVRIMDTHEFQRLRTLKQLGGSAFVYPDASHSRFEHSLGVAFLSRRLVEHLQAAEQRQGLPAGQPPIDARDVTCVSLAGLVHDLGHGPFSHMFEEFVKHARQAAGDPEKFEHEHMSVAILELLLEINGISLERYMGTTEAEAAADLAFVLKLISGLPPGAPVPPECGRPPSKRFLFEIVANKRNGK